MNTNILSNKISELRARYHFASQGKQALIDLINESEISEHVYNSNAIENSTLTLDETEKILLQIELDRYISERELFEAKNLAAVIKYISGKALYEPLTLDVILLLHKMLLDNFDGKIAGRFRAETEWVRVGNYIAVDPKIIVPKLEEMLTGFMATDHLPIASRIAKLHLTFEHIHPFVDGNGRIGRVINNYLLIREGFVPINIKFRDRKQYYEAFKEFDSKGKSDIMHEIILRSIINSFYKRLTYLEGKEIITLAEFGKRTDASHSNLLNKANRQTIEAFTEKGIWKIGI
jgi:Fic family protein